MITYCSEKRVGGESVVKFSANDVFGKVIVTVFVAILLTIGAATGVISAPDFGKLLGQLLAR